MLSIMSTHSTIVEQVSGRDRTMVHRVLVTGSQGFLGAGIVTALGDSSTRVRRFARRSSAGATADVVIGDVRDPDAVREALRDVDVLIHAASYVGPDPERQMSVNVQGTQNVIAAARSTGVRDVIYISTAGVYGRRLGQGMREGEMTERPVSALSHSRRIAEEAVLGAGGLVLRPHFVAGAGDQWFLGQLLELQARVGRWIAKPDARISTIGREQLGAAVARVVEMNHMPTGVLHAAGAMPVEIGRLLHHVYSHAGVRPPAGVATDDEIVELASHLGIEAGKFDLVRSDNWLSSESMWNRLGWTPQEDEILSTEALDWYARILQENPRG
ncbi:NAD(P)-dependent oxidoreductase [Microbacterium sp.]|uniref:NAD-dependent epimerase/dehydratase family protein n=1 Tax=Microbacterium sp. TaxID=51671 RepID=UPI002734D0D0|nr:NAD-dependent epimerase/dehydratase family protein [Microbacterium sp.]MDP3949525.1 NAD-dependent epimerase/dehydratase family protein [Microbacterium sp.]